VIHNIYAPEGTVYSVHYYDGTDDILVGNYNTSLFNLQLHATNGTYVRVRNDSGASAILAADGMTTK
jgi:hypothetical protein